MGTGSRDTGMARNRVRETTRTGRRMGSGVCMERMERCWTKTSTKMVYVLRCVRGMNIRMK